MAEILTNKILREFLNKKPPLVEAMINLDIQVQVNGIELTLSSVQELSESGAIGFENIDRKLPKTKTLEFDPDGWLHLQPGAYKVIYNEIVHIPNDIVALGRPRSSLLRCGVTVETALWDSGYSGRSEGLLIVYNRKGFTLKKDSRLIQLIFFRLDEPVITGYTGQYQRENIRDFV